MSAMAFEVNPVRPSVALVVGFSVEDMSYSFLIDLNNSNGRTAVSLDGNVP
jgi:hypothetical protein